MATHKMLGFFPDSEGSDTKLDILSTKDRKKFIVPAHSQVLAAASTVFANAMKAGSSSGDPSKVLTLKVEGDTNDALFFLRYLYTNSLDNADLEACMSLMKTAQLYDVTGLSDKCEQKIMDIVTPLDICRLNRVKELFSVNFINFCVDILLKAAGYIFMADLSIRLEYDTLELMLKRENLNVANEVQVLEALWKWGHAKSVMEGSGTPEDTRNKIRDLLPSVRWSLINDVDRNAPWFEVAMEFKAKHTRESTKRMGDPKISLNKYAKALKIPEKSTVVYDRFYILEMATLIKFSLSKRVLVTGFLMRLDSTLGSYSSLPFKVLLNKTDYTGLISFETVVRSRHTEQLRDTRKDIYSRDFRVEFLRPVLLPKDETLDIGITPSHSNLYAPAYTVRDATLESVSHSDPMLTVDGNVLGIQHVFYFC